MKEKKRNNIDSLSSNDCCINYFSRSKYSSSARGKWNIRKSKNSRRNDRLCNGKRKDRDKNIEFKLSKNKLYNKSELIRLSKNYVCSSSWGMSSKIFVARWNKMYKTQVVKKIIDLYSELNLTRFEDSYFNFLILNNINSIKTLSAANGYHYCIVLFKI